MAIIIYEYGKSQGTGAITTVNKQLEVCLKSNGTVHVARATFITQKKHWFYDVTMSCGF